MALAAPKISVSTVKTQYAFTGPEFDWPAGTSGQLEKRLSQCITRASIKVQQLIGTATYAATGDLTVAQVYQAELAYAGHFALRERLQILSGRPEEAPPEEYVDRSYIEGEIERLEADATELLAEHIIADLDAPGTGFAFGAKGVDETEADIAEGDYDDTDFDALPSD